MGNTPRLGLVPVDAIPGIGEFFRRNEEWLASPEGIEATRRKEEEDRERERINKRLDAERRLRVAGVPKRHHDAFLTGALDESLPAMVAVKNYLERGPENLLLTGGRGLGKTVAAAYAAHTTRGGRFVRVADVSRVIFEKEGRDYDDDAFLALDDLGVEFMSQTGAFAAFFDALIDRRYSDGLRTIVTTNLPVRDLEARYGSRFIDRWRETGSVVELQGKSMRKGDPK